MFENATNMLLTGAVVVLAILIFCCLIRVIRGPKIVDRIVAVNMIGTMTIMMIAILSVRMKESYLLDVSLIYAMLSFLAVVVLTKVYLGVYQERMEKRGKQLEDLKKQGKEEKTNG